MIDNVYFVIFSETLAWASAQIHCQCSVSESRVVLQKSAALSSSDVSTTGKETSFVPSRGMDMFTSDI